MRTWINGALKNGNDSGRKRDEASNGQISDRIMCFDFRRRASSEANTLDRRNIEQIEVSAEPRVECILT